MSDTMIVAVLSLAGTLIGSLGGILAASKLTNWRLQQLEAKVDKHNHLVERMTLAENDIKHIGEALNALKGD